MLQPDGQDWAEFIREEMRTQHDERFALCIMNVLRPDDNLDLLHFAESLCVFL